MSNYRVSCLEDGSIALIKVPCGRSHISPKKKCSKGKAATTPKESKEKFADKKRKEKGLKSKAEVNTARSKESDEIELQTDAIEPEVIEPDDRTLEELFIDADRVGNKYQTDEERVAYNQELGSVAGEISDAIDRYYPDSTSEVKDYSGKNQPIKPKKDTASKKDSTKDPTSKEAIASRMKRMKARQQSRI